MIRIEVTSEADVTRMVAAFTTLPVLRDSDYEVFLLPHIWPHDSSGRRRAWRKDGQRGGTGQASSVHFAGAPAPASAGGGGGGGGGTGEVRSEPPRWTSPPPECPVTGWPQIDRPDLDMCTCGHRHLRIEAWGAGTND